MFSVDRLKDQPGYGAVRPWRFAEPVEAGVSGSKLNGLHNAGQALSKKKNAARRHDENSGRVPRHNFERRIKASLRSVAHVEPAVVRNQVQAGRQDPFTNS